MVVHDLEHQVLHFWHYLWLAAIQLIEFFAVMKENLKWGIYNHGYLTIIYSHKKEILHSPQSHGIF